MNNKHGGTITGTLLDKDINSLETYTDKATGERFYFIQLLVDKEDFCISISVNEEQLKTLKFNERYAVESEIKVYNKRKPPLVYLMGKSMHLKPDNPYFDTQSINNFMISGYFVPKKEQDRSDFDKRNNLSFSAYNKEVTRRDKSKKKKATYLKFQMPVGFTANKGDKLLIHASLAKEEDQLYLKPNPNIPIENKTMNMLKYEQEYYENHYGEILIEGFEGLDDFGDLEELAE